MPKPAPQPEVTRGGLIFAGVMGVFSLASGLYFLVTGKPVPCSRYGSTCSSLVMGPYLLLWGAALVAGAVYRWRQLNERRRRS